ncbi:ankyrin [Hypomontagnella monticulosa]|nr:ankyrin [Hypomontagnella monticulosa]
MDPLSITASVVALAQAMTGIAKGVRFLRSLGQTSFEFNDFVNELSTLQAVTEQVSMALRPIQDQLQDKSITSFSGLDPSLLAALRDDLAQIILDLGSLCERLRLPEKKKEKADNRGRISKLKWQKEKENIAKLKEKVRGTRQNLNLCFSALAASQSYQHTRLTLEIREAVCTSARAVSQLDKRHNAAQEENRILLRALSGSINQLNHNLLGKEEASKTNQIGRNSRETETQETAIEDLGEDTTAYFEASLVQDCSYLCDCNCHRLRYSQSPWFLSPFIGSLFMQYNVTPLFQRPVCDFIGCKANHTSSLRLYYAFPRWLLARSVEFVVSLSSMTGAGSSLHLRIPRLLGRHQVWTAIQIGDLRWIQVNMAKKVILPTDRSVSVGRSLLCVALLYSKFEIAKFLVQQGCDPNSRDDFGVTPAEYARFEMSGPRKLSEPFKHFLYGLSMKRISDRPLPSSRIHHIVSHIGKDELSAIVLENLSHINSVDGYGCTPLQHAVMQGYVAAVRTLLKAGARMDIADYSGSTPLMAASRLEDTHIAELLLDAGANVNYFDPRTGQRLTSFMVGKPDMLRLLLSYGAPVTWRQDSFLSNPLTNAARKSFDIPYDHPARTRWADSLDCLIRAGVDINDQNNRLRMTPIMSALMNRNALLVDLLIRAGAWLDVVDMYGRGILHYAASGGNIEAIDSLRRAKISGVDPDMTNIWGDTPLQTLQHRISQSDDDLDPGMHRPTDNEIQAFEQLIKEIRERNTENQRANEAEHKSHSSRESEECEDVQSEDSTDTNSCSSGSDEFFDCEDD